MAWSALRRRIKNCDDPDTAVRAKALFDLGEELERVVRVEVRDDELTASFDGLVIRTTEVV
jgi:hypothetical protein